MREHKDVRVGALRLAAFAFAVDMLLMGYVYAGLEGLAIAVAGVAFVGVVALMEERRGDEECR